MRLEHFLATLVLAAAIRCDAAVDVTETPTRITVENESVRLAFAPQWNYVLNELAYKRGSGQNLIVDSFILYYQFIENGAIRSANEGSGAGITNGQYRLIKKEGAATVEFQCDTPHFHLTRRITVPDTGPEVKFEYELECIKSDNLSVSLPYAPLSSKLDTTAAYRDFIGPDGRKTRRLQVETVKSPKLRPAAPYTRTECFYNSGSGEGILFAHVPAECATGISRRETHRFEPGQKEKCTFVIVPFKGDAEQVLAARLSEKESDSPDRSNSSVAVVVKKTPDLVIWADHATRKVFPAETVPAAPERNEVEMEAAGGEVEPFQIIVSPQKDLVDVKLILVPLTNGKGDRIAVENLRYNPIGSLRSSYGEDIPDLLLQKTSVTCPKGRNTAFWVTVKVPQGTPAGTYKGTLNVVSNDEKLAEVGLRLKVWNFALAPTPHICAFGTDYVYYYDKEIDLNNETEAKAQALSSKGTAEEVTAYYTRMRFIAEHRIYETHFGPRPNYSGAMRVQWQQKDGRWDFSGIDFKAFDKAREFCYRELHWPRFAYDPELVPYLGFINQFTFGGKDEKEYWYMRYWDPVLPKKDPKKYRPSIYDLNDDFTPEFKEKFLRYIKTIAEHCRAEGISIDENGNGPVLFLADEIPDYSSGHPIVKKTLELARLIKQVAPRAVLVINGRDIPEDPEVLNLFDLWTARAPAQTLSKLRKLGKRYGDYYMHGYFNLRDPAINPRVQFWSYWKYEFFWIGDWAMTMTPDQRWYGSRRNYENNWWFPCMTNRYGAPMSTIRFELMREGLEDHEYLWMLREAATHLQTNAKRSSPTLLARTEALLKRAEAVGGSYRNAAGESYYFDGYLLNPVELLALRHEIGELLDSITRNKE